MSQSYPDFSSAEFLNDHISKTLAFYEGRAVDPEGGFFHCFKDDGTIYDRHTRLLVSSCRFVFNYAMAYRERGEAQYKDKVLHGLDYLRSKHRQPDGSYIWQFNEHGVEDGRIMAYGHAFVMVATANAVEAGIQEASDMLDDIWHFMEQHFWDPTHGAYADEYSAGMAELSPYRGQNANMHSCEGCIAAFKATGDERYLTRAEALAQKFTVELPKLTEGLIWEHYTQDWQPDFEYHKDKPNDLFKPWGIQPGHLVEWARLLLQLDELRAQDWYLPRAVELFNAAIKHGTDHELGGLVYGFAPDGSVCAREKYYWVHSEAAATAWRLHQRTGGQDFLAVYNRCWEYAWDNLIDHEYGAWFRVLTPEGQKIDDLKSPPGKTDYHTVGVCWDILGQSGS